MVGLIIGIGGSFVLAAMVATFWVRGIDYMKENHPDYEGEEFLNWDRKNDDWDKSHTEGDFE